MLRTILKAVAYTRMPRTTFMVSHPRAASRMLKARWDMKHALAPRISAVGAAMIALPVGYAIGRALRGGSGFGRTSTSGPGFLGSHAFGETETAVAD